MAPKPNTNGKRYIIDKVTGRRRLWREEDGEGIQFVPAPASAGVALSNATNKLFVGCGATSEEKKEKEEKKEE